MSALPGYKEIMDLLKKGLTLEAQEKIMELREACVELEDENHELKKRLKILEDALSFKGTLEFKAPFYYQKGDATPYCPRCWEKEQEGIHLAPEHWDSFIIYRKCPECVSVYKVRDGN